MKNIRSTVQGRIGYVALVMIGVLVILVFRYAYLQIVQGDALAQRMRDQSGYEFHIQSLRGAILDRGGKELAVSSMTKSLFVDPNHVYDTHNPEEIASDIAPLIGLTEQDILDDIARGGGFVWVKRRLEHTEYEAVRAVIREKGYSDCLGFQNEAKRYYPNDALAANVIGFVGTDDEGLDGVEQALDPLLKGEVREERLTVDGQRRPILDSIFAGRRVYGSDYCKTVSLTIDSTIQFMVEQELDRAMAENNPDSITAIVMDPKTGEILAMASRPSYNPNRFWEYPQENWKNRAVAFIYEPGSTFKAVIAGAALQEAIVTPNQVFFDPGYVMVSGRRIQNWSNESYGAVTFTDIVKKSLNTGFAQVGLSLGAEKMMHYTRVFGFGERTGIDLPGEEEGILFSADDMRDSDIATTAIGQSIAVTPLQLVTAMAAIANGGTLMHPYIVREIRNPDGSVYEERTPREIRRVLEPTVDRTLIGLLEQVVASGGGMKAGVKGYRIAGKTGTAQKIRRETAGYLEGRYIASFCGFAPVEDPIFTVLVMIDDPRGGDFYGGQIAAPVASRIFTQLLRYAHVEPSSNTFAETTSEREKGRSDDEEKRMEAAATPPEGKAVVPDFTGLSLREAARLAELRGLTFESEGTGAAVSQSLSVNDIVDQGERVKVYFHPT
ncbi:penicillin-binding protein [Selenomonas sp. oral taxon 149]|uniref:penicillin-binding protein n=1 Tax=Selenomonas sp. oral taxon 149 TaxID=712535 RepID=UPI0001E0DA7A|nr:penicillin-binding transpeptidase domain-containing protein [Selenomonas sp. oral taxon 149]EFM23085.1 penicillin-binding protein, transpeptidase domain protein [Selenomonas sp. oral taxon 149 str. 67H29BP]